MSYSVHTHKLRAHEPLYGRFRCSDALIHQWSLLPLLVQYLMFAIMLALHLCAYSQSSIAAANGTDIMNFRLLFRVTHPG